jgi:hypothetical protein
MGTRGTTGFIANGEQFASYQQFDSYPAGVGVQVLKFAREHLSVPALRGDYKAAVSRLVKVDESGKPTDEQREALKDFTDTHVSTGADWYATLRKCQGEPGLILKSGYITDSISSFNNEEYDWVIDFDANEFIGYAGNGFEIARYSLDALPTDEEFTAAAEKAEEALQDL